MNNKHYIFLFLILGIIFPTQAQKRNFPKNSKPGDCYWTPDKKVENAKFIKIDCYLMFLSRKEINALQYKLKNNNYPVEVTECLDKATIDAYELYKKDQKKALRQKRKQKRKKRRNKSTE